jgi:quinol monooxygenase YgiN
VTVRQWKEWLMSDQDSQDKPLFLVVTIKPRLDRLDEAEAQLQSMRQNTLEEPGCVFMHLVQPQDDPDTWVMLEMFRSRAAWDEHMRQPYNTEGNKILEDLLRGPSDHRLLEFKL